jgi:hypothetical protein
MPSSLQLIPIGFRGAGQIVKGEPPLMAIRLSVASDQYAMD